MDVLVFGLGQVGTRVVSLLETMDISVCGFSRSSLDVTNQAALQTLIRSTRPRVVVNTSANTKVDGIEEDTAQAIDALRVNGWAPRHMAEACRDIDALFIHISSDYVYTGVGDSLLKETQTIRPVNKYGLTKAIGDAGVALVECRHVTLRTEWVYAEDGVNFLTTMVKLFRDRQDMRVVDDQHGSPTSARSLARAISWLVQTELGGGIAPDKCGVYHWADCGGDTAYASWYEFARLIWWESLAKNFKCQEVLPISSSDFPRPAARPANSRLSCAKFTEAFGLPTESWLTEAALVCKILKNS